MPTMSELKKELDDEMSTILSRDFGIVVQRTKHVPHASDGAITFPNLDDKTQGCKLIDTAVLYIDIRRSTELNLAHKPQTVAKLYSAFVRGMTKAARHNGGHVRGIIGDRVMVIFDSENAAEKAVETAILMNSTAQYVLNKHFTRNEVSCGIGIDMGQMLATKTGFRRRGVEQSSYRNLVWLGRPANVASKLTDIANKPSEKMELDVVHSGFDVGTTVWTWVEQFPGQFVKELTPAIGGAVHCDRRFRHFFVKPQSLETRAATPPILMTATVFDAFRKLRPTDRSVTERWFHDVDVQVPGYSGRVVGGDVVKIAFK